MGGSECSFAQGCVKDFRCLARIGHHQKTEAIELKKILLRFSHADFFSKRQCYAPRADRKRESKRMLLSKRQRWNALEVCFSAKGAPLCESANGRTRRGEPGATAPVCI